MVTGSYYKSQHMWPGFRVTKLKRNKGKYDLKVDILEPSFYWRVNRDYDDVPVPKILYFDPNNDNLEDIKNMILAEGASSPRLVLHPHSKSARFSVIDILVM